MLPQKMLECLLMLLCFILFYKFSEAATLLPTDDVNTIATPTTPQMPTPMVAVAAGAAATARSAASKRDAYKRAFGDCDNELSWMCLKIEFVKLLERLADRDELSLVPGVSVVRDVNATAAKNADLMADVARSYPNDPDARLNGFIVNKLGNFLQTRMLRFKLADTNAIADARSAIATGRKGKFGKKGGLEAIIAAGLMMKGTLMAIGMGAIALMAGKALMTALMALTLSGVLGLKSLASGGGKSTTYEIVAKPIYTSSHSHSVSHEEGHGHGHGHYGSAHSASGYGGYARALQLEMPNHLATPLNVQ